MKIKIDESMPASLKNILKAFDHDVDTVFDEHISGAEDHAVWSAAQLHERFLITQDLDFSDTRKFKPGTHHGILLVRLHKANRRSLIAKVKSLFSEENVEDWNRGFVIATENKLRIRK